jgi:hypothetical protein
MIVIESRRARRHEYGMRFSAEFEFAARVFAVAAAIAATCYLKFCLGAWDLSAMKEPNPSMEDAELLVIA